MLNATTLAVLEGWLTQVADEMDAVFARSAFSPIISEQLDRACGIYDCHDGGLIAQGHTGMPIFVGTTQFAVKQVIEKVKKEGVSPGDAYILNDPFISGTHLHDMKVIAPVFIGSEIICYVTANGHWVDVGSSQPGGFSPGARSSLEEGLRVPTVKILREGKLIDDVLDLILANVRLPRESRADAAAAFSAIRVGTKRIEDLVQKYSTGVFLDAIQELRRRGAAHVRSCLQEIPDGTYKVSDYLDDDGIGSEPLLVSLSITVTGDTAVFDFAGSSPPCRGPYNSPLPNVLASCYIALKHVFPDIPLNAGAFEPLTFNIPKGTFLNADFPAPHGGYLDVCCRVLDVVLQALGQAIPEKVPALPFSTLPCATLGGMDPRTGRYFVVGLFAGGGYGGNAVTDGLNNGALPIGVARVGSVEVMEGRFPLLYRSYALRRDSGGAGTRRGGCGSVLEVEILSESAVVSTAGDRIKFAPLGLAGGLPGAKTEIQIERDGALLSNGKVSNLTARRGDLLRIAYPGGGGYGKPQLREPALVARDVRLGLVSLDRALADYSVVLDTGGNVDEACTKKQRETAIM